MGDHVVVGKFTALCKDDYDSCCADISPTVSLPTCQLDNGSEGTDDVDGESSMRTKHAIEILHVKIQKTRDQIKKEQDNKECMCNN